VTTGGAFSRSEIRHLRNAFSKWRSAECESLSETRKEASGTDGQKLDARGGVGRAARRQLMKKLSFAALAVLTLTPTPGLDLALAQPYHHRVYYNGRHYHRHHCGGGNGAVGTVAGGVGGALIGHSMGGTAGTVLGGVGGALLGRHLDKSNTRHRRGC